MVHILCVIRSHLCITLRFLLFKIKLNLNSITKLTFQFEFINCSKLLCRSSSQTLIHGPTRIRVYKVAGMRSPLPEPEPTFSLVTLSSFAHAHSHKYNFGSSDTSSSISYRSCPLSICNTNIEYFNGD